MTIRTTRRTTHTAVVLAATAALLLAPVGAAEAHTVTNTDARGDVTVEHDADTVEPAPDRVDGDIVYGRFFHARYAGAVVDFAELRRPREMLTETLEITTDEGLHRHVQLRAADGDAAGSAALYKDASGDQVTCPGLIARINYKRNRVVIRVPRSCLSRPHWVRLGFLSDIIGGDDESSFVDDAIRDSPIPTSDEDIRMSRRIHRGK